MDFAQPLQALIPGVTGRVLAVLVNTSLPLSGRAIAQLSDVSPSQAARVLPRLVDLGVVTAQDAPPAVLYSFVPDHVSAAPLAELSRPLPRLVRRLREQVAGLDPAPVSVVAYGSFARGEARADSDIDLVVVRPASVPEDDEAWEAGIDRLRDEAQRASGNRVDILEVSEARLVERLRSGRPLWRDIVRDAVVIHGPPLAEV